VGVTVTVAVIGAVPLFIAVKLGIVLVVPEVGVRPIVLLLIDQENVAGLTVELNVLAATTPCLQTVMFDKFCICGLGFTVIVKVLLAPEHPFAVGVTTIVLTWAEFVVLSVVKLAMLPEPFAALNPVVVLELVQLN